ncbi:MAG: endolytic transglycosylase MltG [Ruminococcaceae bacterium]|nr:endolytic transglycosylase MltG [Oscillospiraceae bacterium]
MSNSDDIRRRHTSSDDAYDELMNSYFGTGTGKTDLDKTQRVPSASKTPASQKKFKVDIKDLDSEFNSSVPTIDRNAVSKKAKYYEPIRQREPANKTIKRYTPVSRDEDDDIKLYPTFESQAGIEPKKSAPAQRKKKKKGLFSKPKAPANTGKTAPAGAKAPVRRGGKAPIISRVNTQKAKFSLQKFLSQHKKGIAVFLICVTAAIIISSYTISCINDVLAMNRDSENVVIVNLPAEVDTNGAIDILRDNKLIKHKAFCKVFAKFMKYRDDNYLTGLYYLTESMGLENMLSTFKKPTNKGETVTLTFPEGYNVNQIAEKLEKYEVCPAENFYTTVKQIDFSSEYSFIASEPDKEKRYQVLEGYLYPDTYEFFLGENPAEVIRKFLNNFKEKWTEEYAAQAQKLGMSVDDVITLASIIEKEAYGADQMPLVSSVLHNRLNHSGLYPTLQCHATTVYIDEYISKNVTNAVDLGAYKQRYDTSRVEGLPVGAICNPGNDSIHAALFPSETGYYFFAHDDEKKIYLATTDSEQSANLREIRKINAAIKTQTAEEQ